MALDSVPPSPDNSRQASSDCTWRLSKVRGDDWHRASTQKTADFRSLVPLRLSVSLFGVDLPSLLFGKDCTGSNTIHSNNPMNHNTWMRALLCAFVVLFVGSTHVCWGNHRSSDSTVNFPPQIVQLKTGCLWIDGTLTSGNFFEGLERKDRDGLFEYMNSGKLLTDYPQSVVASIRILDDQCVSTFSPSRFSLGDGRRGSFSFQVAWKTGLQLRPALLAPEGVHCIDSPGTRATPTLPMTCQMTVKSDGTPLSDHLIVSVFGADGTWLTRLSAAP